jgi:HEXXH motif-containing protein
MTDIVVQTLQQGAEANAYRLRFLKFGLLQDSLRGHKKLEEKYEQLWAALGSQPATQILATGSPFFWKNLHRCCLEGVRNMGDLATSVDYMLRMAFDSFFDWLPDGFSLECQPTEGSNLVLPLLGVRIPSAGKSISVCKLSGSEIGITGYQTKFVVDLNDVPSEFRIRKIGIAGSDDAHLVMLRDPSIFENDYIDRVDPETEQADFLAKLISKSLELIAAAMPELERRFAGFIRWYFPIDAPDELTHNSLSVKFMTGAIFLSVAYHDFRLAEAMVHELHHNELFLLQESETLFESDDQKVFYSPFRPDARPLNGLFHALFVFTGVADFIARAEELTALSDWHRSLRYRRMEVVRQVRLGLAQIPRDCLTDLGSRIIRSIETSIEEHESEVGPLQGPLPMPLARHLAEWARTHPQLTDNVRIPPGVERAAM